MSTLAALGLGVLQGLTEFLPISSSGHLALAELFLGVRSPGVTFEVFVHFGTALAVIVYFRRRVGAILVALARWAARREHDAEQARLGLLLILATVPAAVVGVLFESAVEEAFENPVLVSSMLLVTGFILYSTRAAPRGAPRDKRALDAVLIGAAQAAAVLPGISRSGATISAGLGLRLGRRAAAEFAFLLSVPVILGATVMSAADVVAADSTVGLPVAVGTVAAFGSALPAIAILMRVVTAGTFHRFAYYCWGAGGLGFVLTAVLK